MKQEIRFCTTFDGVRIAYSKAGAGPPLVKAPNWLSHLEFEWESPIWRHFLQAFTEHFQLIRFDERGNGLSDWDIEDLSFEAWTRDLDAVVEATGVERFPLLGISQGGAVAVDYAVRHPERVSHLILYGAYARGWDRRPEYAHTLEYRKAMTTLVRHGWGQDNPGFRQMWTSLFIPGATSEQTHWFNDLQRITTSPENAYRLLIEASRIDVADRLPQVKAPTLVLHCEEDAVVPLPMGRELATQIPGARFVALRSKNHLLIETEPAWQVFLDEVREFLGVRPMTLLKKASGATTGSWEFSVSPGKQLRHYHLKQELGRGGMGAVFLARDEKLDRDVALKVISSTTLVDEAMRKRFRKEALALAKLNHPHIATVHDFDTENGVDFLVMEYVTGETLSEKLTNGPLPENEILRLGFQISTALEEAHDQGVIHRDLKPGNVMVTPKGDSKVLDFGLAKLQPQAGMTDITQSATDTHKVAGTLPYMAPEQMYGKPGDARTDIYSLGATLYEMSTGERPFKETDSTPLIASILQKEPKPPRRLQPNISSQLERVILKCLKKKPEDRYQSAKKISEELEILGMPDCSRVTQWAVRARYAWRKILAGTAAALVAVLFAVNAGGLRDRWGGGGASPQIRSIRSIAVLPLADHSPDPEQAYFVEGMHEALTAELSKISALRVISRTSAMLYKDAQKPLPEIARELNVDAVVEGSVLRAGNRVRITAQLIHASTDRNLWAESYERDLEDVLTLHSEVARAIAREIQVTLTPRETEHLLKDRSIDPDAYEAYLHGRYHWNLRTKEGVKKGLDYFRKAVDIDPDYALAHVGLADSYIILGANEYGVLPTDEAMSRAMAEANNALAIDGTLAEAHTSLASVMMHYSWDWPGAEREFQRAIELNPNYATAHHWYALFLSSRERHEEALAEISQAQRIDPLSLIINANKGWVLFLMGRYDQAIEQFKRTLELDPGFGVARIYLGLTYEQKGMYEEATIEFQNLKARSGSSTAIEAALGCVYAEAGRIEKGRTILNTLVQRSKTEYVPPLLIARLYLSLGEKDRAFEWLEKAFEERSADLIYLKAEPRFDSLRSDPRFQDLLRRMNFPP